MKKNKENKGITLIALIVTIIVLLILAGTSISVLMADNGIITKAYEAKEAMEKANAKVDVVNVIVELTKEYSESGNHGSYNNIGDFIVDSLKNGRTENEHILITDINTKELIVYDAKTNKEIIRGNVLDNGYVNYSE